MRQFLKATILLLTILFIINGIIDNYVSNLLQYNRGPLYVTWNDITKRTIDANLIVMGNSRAAWQYDPKIIDSVLHTDSYVLGFPGSGMNQQVIKYRIYDNYQSCKPKYIIINVDYVGTLTWTNGFYREQFFPFMTIPYIHRQIKEVETFSFAELYFPVYRYTTYKGLWTLIREESQVVDRDIYNGYSPKDRDWDGQEFKMMESYHFVTDSRSVAMFDEFLQARKMEDIKVIFCFAPIYIGLTDKVDNLEEAYQVFNMFADKYRIPVLDYTYSELSRDTTFFFNAIHLNKKGAEVFTTKLCHDLDSLGLLE